MVFFIYLFKTKCFASPGPSTRVRYLPTVFSLATLLTIQNVPSNVKQFVECSIIHTTQNSPPSHNVWAYQPAVTNHCGTYIYICSPYKTKVRESS